MNKADCPFCKGPAGHVVFSGPRFRILRPQEAGFPAFYRLVWAEHVAELSDLSAADRLLCMESVVKVEQVLRRHLKPSKINLASLGNMVPHLHWHIIARFDWDSHFPAPVWAPAQRQAPADALAQVVAAREAVEDNIRAELT